MPNAVDARRVPVDPTPPPVTGPWTAAPRLRRAARLASVTAALVLVGACDRTSVEGLNVRSGPSTSSAVVASLDEAGTAVVIECHTRGEAVYGDTVWYRISRPYDGYVTNYYVRTRDEVLEREPSC
jgi:uncharacterized protein YraI